MTGDEEWKWNVEDIAPMNSDRGGHGCAHMIIQGKHYIYVTGGYQMSTKHGGSNILQSSEYLDLTTGTWHYGIKIKQ